MKVFALALILSLTLFLGSKAEAQLFQPYIAPQQYGYGFTPMDIYRRDYYYRSRYFNRVYYAGRGGRVYYGLPR